MCMTADMHHWCCVEQRVTACYLGKENSIEELKCYIGFWEAENCHFRLQKLIRRKNEQNRVTKTRCKK